MIAGCPGLREAVFLHIKPPVEPSKASVRMASSRGGISHLGTALDFNSETKADLVVIGSVAVDRKGGLSNPSLER
jgi:5-formyltetrahydrofolate cyclo-ligase